MFCVASCAVQRVMPSSGSARYADVCLLPALIREMGQAYPELIRADALSPKRSVLEETPLPQDAGSRSWPLSDATESLVEGRLMAKPLSFTTTAAFRWI